LQIIEHVKSEFGLGTRITIGRDLNKLIKLNLIVRKGAGRSIKYQLSSECLIIRRIDVEKYFATETDNRDIQEKFNFNIFTQLNGIFNNHEKKHLAVLNKKYQDKIKKISPDVLKKEIERLNIDFSWKSSKIEGNTYSLLETEQLLKNQKSAAGHTKEETTMILNHKAALDFAYNNKQEFKKISIKKIENIHSLLVEDMDVTKGLRQILVRISGTKYTPLDNKFQIEEALKNMCGLVNKTKNPFEKAVMIILFTSYIQPFTDGNKRTSRLSGNAILLAYNCCPLSYRSIDEIEYKKAILLFYEQNNISYFKELFINQFAFAVENYFG